VLFEGRKVIKNLNIFSWTLLSVFLCASVAMEYHPSDGSMEGPLMILPMIIMFVLWSERVAYLIDRTDLELTKTLIFKRDLFLITFSFLFADLLYLTMEYNNADARGWWPLAVAFIGLYGFVFSLVYALFALLFAHHRTYTRCFSGMIIVLFLLLKFLPHAVALGSFGVFETFFVVTFGLLGVHVIICLSHMLKQ
jgi:hypothetical protein